MGVYHIMIDAGVFKKNAKKKDIVESLNKHYSVSSVSDFYKKEKKEILIRIAKDRMPEIKYLLKELKLRH